MRIRSAAFVTALKNELADRKPRITRLKKLRREEIAAAVPEIETLLAETNDIAFDLGRMMIRRETESSGTDALGILEEKERKIRLTVPNLGEDGRALMQIITFTGDSLTPSVEAGTVIQAPD